MNEHIRSIVERSRAGDQVASALIIETRRQARAGNPKAAKSLKLIGRYVDTHPPSPMAGESSLSVNTNPAVSNVKAQQAVWKARRSSPEQFAIVVAKASPVMRIWDMIVAIAHGPKLDKDAPLCKVGATPKSRLAACIRRAFKLQRLADPKVPISTYCRVTGSELGE